MKYTRFNESDASLANSLSCGLSGSGLLPNAEIDLDSIPDSEDLTCVMKSTHCENSNDSDTDQRDPEGKRVELVNYSDTDSASNGDSSFEKCFGNNAQNCDIVEINNKSNTTEIVTYRLVVNYVFDFEMDLDTDAEKLSEEPVTVATETDEASSGIGIDIDDDSDFESDTDDELMGLMRDSSDFGSKNNLLDESMNFTQEHTQEECYNSSFEDRLDKALEVFHNSEAGVGESDSELEEEPSYVENDDECYGGQSKDLSNTASSNDSANTTRSSPEKCMRKGFIYYSSEAQLFKGDLHYSHCDLSSIRSPLRRRNTLKKLFRRVFPSHKYVVNQ